MNPQSCHDSNQEKNKINQKKKKLVEAFSRWQLENKYLPSWQLPCDTNRMHWYWDISHGEGYFKWVKWVNWVFFFHMRAIAIVIRVIAVVFCG
jgi:hypothetical protein